MICVGDLVTASTTRRDEKADDKLRAERAEKKRILYQRAGKKLISLSYRDDPRLIETLREKLSRHFRVGERHELSSQAERNERNERSE